MRQLRIGRPPYVNDAGLQHWLEDLERAINNLPSDVSDIGITSSYTPLVSSQFIFADASTSTISVYLPSNTTDEGSFFHIKKVDSGSNAVVIAGTVDGAANPSLLTQWYSMAVRRANGAYYTV